MNAIVGQTLKGQTKSITVHDDAVTIAYRALYHGFKGDKRIPLSSITAIQFREPGSWIAGYIQFSIRGGIEWTGQINQDENALQFDGKEADAFRRSEEHTSELQSLMRISYAVFCLKKKKTHKEQKHRN